MAITNGTQPPDRILPPDGLSAGLGEPPTVAEDADEVNVTISDDGTVSVRIGAPTIIESKPSTFEDNMAEGAGDRALSAIASDLLEGIQADNESRRDAIEQYNDGLELLGIKNEKPQSSIRGPKRTSKVRSSELLEAVTRYQSSARAELLPATGPVKVRIDGMDTMDGDARAQALEQDLNHYLTTVATEYYPDTDRGLFYLGYGGTIFKKVYLCPYRKRPVSECVYMPDLIASNDITDIQNASRLTHRLEYRRSQVKRMQMAGIWRDVPLMQPVLNTTETQKKEAEIRGINLNPARPKDTPRVIFESYCEIDPKEYGLEEKFGPNGLPLPYRVTLDEVSRTVLDIRRNWKEGDEDFKARRTFVKFGLIPAIGFYDLGFLHLIGNQTRALTALLRLLIDAGMFSNFPGGVKLKGARTMTNEINPGPGEFVEIDSPLDDIRKAMMPMPYQQPSSVLFELMGFLQTGIKSLGGTAMMEVGEGRTNIPVGTIMSMIEIATQVIAACHKRTHQSQAEEFGLLKELFAENPEAIWRGCRAPARKWASADEFEDCLLVPASDPNVPGQIHRIQQAQALFMMATLAPDLFNKRAVLSRALQNIGVGDPDSLLIDPQTAAQPPMDPKALQAEQKMALQQQKDQTDQMEIAAKGQIEREKQQNEMADNAADRQSRENVALMKTSVERERIQADSMKAATSGSGTPGLG